MTIERIEDSFFYKLAHGFVKVLDYINEHQSEIGKFVKLCDSFPKMQPYIEKILADLEDPDYEIGNDVVSLQDIICVIDFDRGVENYSILDVVKSSKFHEDIILFYRDTGLNRNREDVINQVFTMHQNELYSGSVVVLYGLIEGIFTDAFINMEILRVKSCSIYGVRDGGGETDKKFTGLKNKAEFVNKRLGNKSAYINKLFAFKLLSDDENSTICTTRNNILHGNDVDSFNEKRSAQLIMWLALTIISVKKMLESEH